jgi:hypothetical protein
LQEFLDAGEGHILDAFVESKDEALRQAVVAVETLISRLGASKDP